MLPPAPQSAVSLAYAMRRTMEPFSRRWDVMVPPPPNPSAIASLEISSYVVLHFTVEQHFFRLARNFEVLAAPLHYLTGSVEETMKCDQG
jgi:hypothetical protein